MNRLFRSLGPLLLAALACGKVLEYPSSEREQGAALCADRIDNDFDGKLDCEDAECDGSCTEETVADCSDGRDNDGDELIDAEDPRCWPHAPPEALRCAQSAGVEISEHFDVAPYVAAANPVRPWYGSVWAPWGPDGASPVAQSPPHPGPERQDLQVGFDGNTSSSDEPAASLGALVRQPPFSGSWEGFELSFSAFAPPGSLVRVAIVPVELVPVIEGPLPGAESALVAVTLDATRSPPRLTLQVDGLERHGELDVESGGCDARAPCEEGMGRVTVALDDGGLRASYTGPDGSAEADAPHPSVLSVPPSRLVLFGGSATGIPGSRLDDLVLSVKPELPCGFPVPQLEQGCETGELVRFGYAVSVARAADGSGYCALATTGKEDSLGGALAPDLTTAWWSDDGDRWASSATLPSLPDGAVLLGASVAADAEGWHALQAYRVQEESGVKLSFVDGEGCDEWREQTHGPTLPDDAEPPSYVIDGERHEIYFTRAPAGGARHLWRLTRGDTQGEPEELGELPVGTGAPVSVQLVGSRDRVLVFPSTELGGGRGVGVLLADPDLQDFQRIGLGPLLPLPPVPDLPGGGGRLAFDDREVLSAVLFWGKDGGFLLYGARSTHGWVTNDVEPPVIAAGTARVVPAGELLPEPSVAARSSCGDGACGAREDCESCPADCPCSGVSLASDLVGDGAGWETVSAAENPAMTRYFDGPSRELRFAGSESTWSVLPLERPLTGDFELSFDIVLAPMDVGPGLIYVGLGPAPAPGVAPTAGIFVRLSSCPWSYRAAPVAFADGVRFQSPLPADIADYCYGDLAQTTGAWQHVVLRREGGTASVMGPADAWRVASEGATVCGSAEVSTLFAGALPPLANVLVGSFESQSVYQSGAIANLELRLLDDPDDCPDGERVCAEGVGQRTCVDVSQSAEHCGACGERCGAHEICVDGRCRCGSGADYPGVLECDGACVDPLTSLEHCGACGNRCKETCLAGACDPITHGDCASPFEIPPDGGDLLLALPSLSSPEGYGASTPFYGCEGSSYSYLYGCNLLVGSFTPSRNGILVVDVDAGDPSMAAEYLLDSIVGITTDPSCSAWLACNDDIVLLEVIASHLTYPVEAGTTYYIGVEFYNYRPPEAQRTGLHIGFEP